MEGGREKGRERGGKGRKEGGIETLESPEGAEPQRGATLRRGVARHSRPLFLVDWPAAVAPDLAVFSSGVWWAFGTKAQWWPCAVVVADPVVC